LLDGERSAKEDKIAASFNSHDGSTSDTNIVAQSVHLQAFRNCHTIEAKVVS
jgi:hypothetical protein